MISGYHLFWLAAILVGVPVFFMPLGNFIVVMPALLLIFILLLVLSYRLFDRLLKIQFTHAHEEWEQQGSLSGYFYAPPGSRKVSLRTRGDQYSRWFTDRPSWIDTGHSANLYKWFTVSGRLTILAGVPVIIGLGRLTLALMFGLLALVGFENPK